MPQLATARSKVRFWRGKRNVTGGVRPYAKIDVKPYAVIMLESGGKRRILCGGGLGLPLVFDTVELAKIFAELHELEGYRIRKMELEELARKCRDKRTNFDSFYLIDHESQLG